MFSTLRHCGTNMQVRAPRVDRYAVDLPLVPMLSAVAFGAIAFIAFHHPHAIIPAVSIAILISCNSHQTRERRVVDLHMNRWWICEGARRIQFADVLSVTLADGVVHLITRHGRMDIQLSTLDVLFQETFVRHLQARVRLARGVHRSRAEAAALEAFFVFDVDAVVVRRDIVVAHMTLEEALVHRAQRIFVRRAPAIATPYRSPVLPRNVRVLEE
jgi:hypothetical protein